ncbi:protein OXIDATIVE STRESS 3 LIKE 1-like [Gastrolobium bilobum]|uniref:protein OXIDATIVE STRESS 3 LIKE 1-like n=1 Tax=Gastrolobium bilobum TaxID=150636 RepID=UPI002AB179AA|nr:protein OXIDATIVE STRESS 3 LIKE 1-like [Gastrolobium bilobum]
MSLALQSNGGGVTIGRSSFVNCVSICDRDFPAEDSDSSGSSIGRKSTSSEDSSDREDSGEVEVQSSFKGPLETLNDLEEDLPVKRGISKFYSGKSKSFTCLADAAAATSMQDIVKPEDPYAKKRKNLLARNILIDRSRSYSDNIGGISKRPANIGRGTSCLTLSSSGCEEGQNSESISPPCPLPPLHPRANRSSANASPPRPPTLNSPWRSYSWSDLQSVAAEAHDISGLAICSGNKVH